MALARAGCCRGAVQLPRDRSPACRCTGPAGLAGENPLRRLPHQPGLSRRDAGHRGPCKGLRCARCAAAGGQRPRCLPELSGGRQPPPHCTGCGDVLRFRAQDPAGPHRRRLPASGAESARAGGNGSPQCAGAVRLHKPVLSDPAIPRPVQPVSFGGVSAAALLLLRAADQNAPGAERTGRCGRLSVPAGGGRPRP